MKSISATIVICAGIYGLTHTATLLSVPHYTPTSAVLGFTASIVVIVLGLIGWWAALKYDR